MMPYIISSIFLLAITVSYIIGYYNRGKKCKVKMEKMVEKMREEFREDFDNEGGW